VKNLPNDLLLHSHSLQIASLYHSLVQLTEGKSVIETQAMLSDVIIAYRALRRHITTDSNGDRFGARQAHHAMQGTIGEELPVSTPPKFADLFKAFKL